MFQVAYTYQNPWPTSGPLQIKRADATLEVNISPEMARRKANGFIGGYITLMAQAGQPMLLLENPPVWQIPIHLHLPRLGNVGSIGVIYVNALTGAVVPLTEAEITQMQELAHALATHFTSTTTPAN